VPAPAGRASKRSDVGVMEALVRHCGARRLRAESAGSKACVCCSSLLMRRRCCWLPCSRKQTPSFVSTLFIMAKYRVIVTKDLHFVHAEALSNRAFRTSHAHEPFSTLASDIMAVEDGLRRRNKHHGDGITKCVLLRFAEILHDRGQKRH